MLNPIKTTFLLMMLVVFGGAGCSKQVILSTPTSPIETATRVSAEAVAETSEAPSTSARVVVTESRTIEPVPEITEALMTKNCPASNAIPQIYYVRVDGNDENTGLGNSPDEAFATIPHAVSVLCGGDHLYVEDGIYAGNGILIENLHGSPENPTVISALHTWGAKIVADDHAEAYADGIRVANSSYIEIAGFEINGNAIGMGSGIDVREGSHHVTIRDHYVRDYGCNGISGRTSDYLIFEGNVVRGNAKRSEWNCSGISIWHPIEHDQEAGFHIIIRRNVVFENECDLPFRPFGHKTPTDGNGIIIDDFRNTQGGGQEGGYQASVLVENNLSFNNGGRGIHVYESDNTVIRNNTVYHNQRILAKYTNTAGEVSLYNSHGSQVYNNLAIQNPDLFVPALILFGNDGMNTRVFNNIIIGRKHFSNQTVFDEFNEFLSQFDQEYPQLFQPSVDVEFNSIADFRRYFGISGSSPAANAGYAGAAPEDDLDGNRRDASNGIDIGCYRASDKGE